MAELMSTETAQRRLLEVIAALEHADDGVAGLMAGMEPAIEVAEAADCPEMAAVFRAIYDLAAAIGSDLQLAEVRHG